MGTVFASPGFWFSLISLVFTLILGGIGYGKLLKEVQTLCDSVGELKKFKESQMQKNLSFETRESAKECRDNHNASVKQFATKDELVSVADRIRDSLAVVVDRIKEDRDKNNNQHKEFYGTDDKVIAIATSLGDVSRRVSAVEEDTKSILSIVSYLKTVKESGI